MFNLNRFEFFNNAARKLILSMMVSGVCSSVSFAATLLTVDITDPSAVVFSSTGNFSSSEVGSSSGIGFTLQGFFTSTFQPGDLLSNVSLSGAISGDLDAGTNDSDVFGLFFGEGTADLNFFAGSDRYEFTTDTAAFSGSAIVDLNFLSSALPEIGQTGSIFIGDGFFVPLETTLGEFVVVGPTSVPLPAGLPLLLIGIGALGIASKRIGS